MSRRKGLLKFIDKALMRINIAESKRPKAICFSPTMYNRFRLACYNRDTNSQKPLPLGKIPPVEVYKGIKVMVCLFAENDSIYLPSEDCPICNSKTEEFGTS